jgi:hypothetical protein
MVAFLPGPAIFFFGGLIHLTPSPGLPADEAHMPQFVGRIAPDASNSRGIYHLFGASGQITLFCAYPQNDINSTSCLPMQLVGVEDLRVVYWPKYRYILSVYSEKSDRNYLSYDSQVERLRDMNEIHAGKRNLLLESWKIKNFRAVMVAFFVFINLVSLLALSNVRWIRWRYR